MAARPGEVPRDLLVLELRGVPGEATRHQVPAEDRRARRLLPHAERFGAGGGPHARRGPRELPGGGRFGDDTRGTARLRGRAHEDRSRCIVELRRGGRARLKAPVLKTGIPQGIGGSNPSPSAIFLGTRALVRGSRGSLAVTRLAWWQPTKYRILWRLSSFGEVAESAEGSRLLSGYRGKTSVPGSNPGLSAKP